MYEERELVCYILVRTDLPSMNPGKAMSQCHHAGVQMVSKHFSSPLVNDYLADGKKGGANSFNTTIVLGATAEQMAACINSAAGFLDSQVVYDRVNDLSYPFFVDSMEIANLIPQDDKIKIIKVMENGKVLMVRPEITCAWFLIDRNDASARSLFDGLNLHP